MLKNNCQCELCRSVWGVGAREEGSVTVEEGFPAAKRYSAVGGGLATQAVTLVLLIFGFLFLSTAVPDGVWYTVPSAVLLSALSAFPVARTGIAILNTLEALYENN